MSDILRIAGAYFIRRDKTTRSPLNTAVAAAYTEALLHEHGAVCILLERARSRTGRIQAFYDDGILDMVVEAALERNQQSPRTFNQLSPPPSPSPSIDSRTTGSASTTASFDAGSSGTRKDTVVVPIHITYEKVPDLRMLIDQVLDQKSKQEVNMDPPSNGGNGTSSATPLSRSTSFLRRSVSIASRAPTHTDNGPGGGLENGKFGRVSVGIGNVVDIKTAKEDVLDSNER
jgi:hypothetical protein